MKTLRNHWKLLCFAFFIFAMAIVMVMSVSAETVANGSFSQYDANATWTWTLDSDGTLTIGGKAANGSTTFYYGSWNNPDRSPWGRTGTINGTKITHVTSVFLCLNFFPAILSTSNCTEN